MRRATCPVGPLMVAVALCAGFGSAVAGETVQDKASQIDIIVPGELRGTSEPSAWEFLYPPDETIETADLPAPAATPDQPLTEEELAQLREALLLAPHELGAPPPRKVRPRRAASTRSNALEVTRNQQPGGLSTVVFNKPIAPETGPWKAKVGADLGMASDANNSVLRPLRAPRDTRGANAAWASVDVHEFASIDARVSPANDQGVVATTFRQSMPVGSYLSMTLQSRTTVTETFGRGNTSAGLSDIPMAALPASDGAIAQRIWAQENSARFNIPATGTTFAAGVSSSSTDTVTHNVLSAEQQLYGPVSVSTAINNAGQSGESRSVSARARFNW